MAQYPSPRNFELSTLVLLAVSFAALLLGAIMLIDDTQSTTAVSLRIIAFVLGGIGLALGIAHYFLSAMVRLRQDALRHVRDEFVEREAAFYDSEESRAGRGYN